MPQYRRKVAFSGKKKKEQIIARRARRSHANYDEGIVKEDDSERNVLSNYREEVVSLNQQPGVSTRVNRYNLKFRGETREEKAQRRALQNKRLEILPETELEVNSEYFYPPGLRYPTRPSWKKHMSKCELDMSENRYFRLFCEEIDKEFVEKDLSMYELNLETWRQLWRVTEMSDIMLVIVDARFPVAQFPPYLYEHLVEKENKGVILILNKCDLLPPSVIVAWELYFSQKFPKLLVVPFSSLEGCKKKRSLLKMAAESSLCLVDACQRLVEDAVNLKSWRNKIEEERDQENHMDEECEVTETNIVTAQSTEPEIYQRYKDGILTIGTIGHPNVGKSSLINALMGKKVVSVSKTPGHTKHFQTIFLTKDIKLCDCPGLVFPSTAEVPLQVLLGSFPIAQVRDPISVVRYVAERLDIPSILKLHQSEEDLGYSEWTSYSICQAWAEKRGYRTRTGGIDVSRGANELLRFCFNGEKSLILFLRPPGYLKNKEKFEFDPRTEKIKLIQGYHASLFEEKVKSVIEEDIEVSEAEEEESEDDFHPVTSTENKFALLPEDD